MLVRARSTQNKYTGRPSARSNPTLLSKMKALDLTKSGNSLEFLFVTVSHHTVLCVTGGAGHSRRRQLAGAQSAAAAFLCLPPIALRILARLAHCNIMRAANVALWALCLISPAYAVQVYLHPQPAAPVPAELDARHASLVLAKHFGLERFESVGSGDGLWNGVLQEQEAVVGNAPKDALLVTLSEEDAQGASQSVYHSRPAH